MNKKKESKVVPNVRFKGFTDDWKQRKLGDDLVSIHTGTNLLGSITNTGMPLIKMGNIQRGYFDTSKVEFLAENEQPDKADIANYGDFFFNTRNTLELVGKGATWMKNSGEYAFNSNIARFELRNLDTIFFNYLYNTDYMTKQIHARAMGTTSVAAIYPKTLDSVEYSASCMKEQQKIGTYFKQIDNLITLHQQKITLLTKLKKAMLEKMFPKKGTVIPEFRFNGFANAWEQRKLSDVVYSVDTGKSKFDKEGSSGEYPILGSTSVIGYDDEYDYEGDFILTARVGANAGSLYRHAGKVKISDNTVFIQASQNIEFLYQLLIRFDIKRLSFGTGQPLVKASELKRLELMIPTNMEEQMRIGVYFKKLDHLITLHQRKLDMLKKLKSACLSEMFI